MRALLLVFGTFVAVHAMSPYKDRKMEWGEFKVEHGKQYEEVEDRFRFEIFSENKEIIEKHNELYRAGKVSYEMGLNAYSDMLHHEFLEKMAGYNHTLHEYSDSGITFIPPANIEEPDFMDWHSHGAVTEVKNQGSCGSCWAFSSTGALEGQKFRKSAKLVSLSEQNLVDCSRRYHNSGCNGGDQGNAFRYIRDNGGIDTEESYPYRARNGRCRFNRKNIGATVRSFVYIPKGNEKALKTAVASIGPIAVSIDISKRSFQHYRRGVYYEPRCGKSLNHAVLVTGYGTLNNKDYWLVKNSWGRSWGDNGYIKMSRNKKNQCGIATEPVYPLI